MLSNHTFLIAKRASILILVLLLISNCQSEKVIKQEKKEIPTQKLKLLDSITISVKLKVKESVILNFDNEYFENNTLKFTNSINKDTIITRKILRVHNAQVFNYGHMQNLANGFKRTSQNILIDKNIKKINFELKNNQLYPIQTNNDVLVTELINDYNFLNSKIYKSKGSLKKKIKSELDSLHKYYQKKYQRTDKSLQIQLNDLKYMYLLERLSPKNKTVELYIQKINFDIIGSFFTGLGYQFVKHRINSFNYKKLNSNKHSDAYIKYITLSVYKFLKHKDNKGDKNFNEAVDWLKTTKFYKENSILVDKNISPLNNNEFKSKLQKLNLIDEAYKLTTFSKVIKDNPSKYYLIDFWATWCAPCISGVMRMEKMKFPKNIKIISLSVDKTSAQDAWKIKTRKLKQKISFLIKPGDLKNKEFLKFIKLNSIPRYILIDSKMNLIDEAFIKPHEPNFLPRLKNIKNAKFW